MSEQVSNSALPSLPSPFLNISGAINLRPFSGRPQDQPHVIIKPQQVFRSGELAKIDDDGKLALRELGITTIFDLRSPLEIARFNSATPDIAGVRIVPTPALTEDVWKDLSAVMQKFKDDELKAHLDNYLNMLQMGGPAFGVIFRHLRDNPKEPCLIHCTVGKDRTGLFAALLYSLLGFSDEDIAYDYGLTTMGLAPYAATMEPRFRAVPAFRDNWEGFLNMGSSRAETMAALLPVIREKFGGASGYLKSHAGLSDDDLTKIRANLLVTE